MKKKTAGILLGMMMLSVFAAGCGRNKATEAANESAQTEKEGVGEDEESVAAEEEKEEKDEEIKEEAEDEMKENASEEEEADDETAETESEPAVMVGVLFPDEKGQRWTADEETLRAELEEAGYEVAVEYADGDVSRQISQIQSSLENEAAALIIAPADPYGLVEVLAEAKEKGVPVFSYDDLIMDSDAVKYYLTFDQRKAGQMVGEEIVKKGELEEAARNKETRSIEFLMGSVDDTGALFFFNGVMEVLQPYFDDGTLVCRSGKTSFDDVGILRWDSVRAGEELADVLEEFYQEEGVPDIVCTGFDGAACAAAETLQKEGYEVGNERWPLITGVGCEADGVRGIAEGKIDSSIFSDRAVLAEKCAEMVDICLKGDSPEVNDYEQYDNGKKIIGTYACESHLITRDDYEVLIDSGLYAEEEIHPVEPADAEETAEQEKADTDAEDRSALEKT